MRVPYIGGMTQQLWTNVYSSSLQMRTSLVVVTPEGDSAAPQDRPDLPEPGLLVLLHGLTGNSQQWPVRTDVSAIADKHNLVIAMPEGQRSFWVDEAYGLNWGTWVGSELPELLRRTLRISSARANTYIGGLSMGGYGAFRAAFDYPQNFAGAFSLSGTLDVSEDAFRGRHPDLYRNGFGSDTDPRPQDNLVARLADPEFSVGEPPTRFFATCGEGDRLYDQNLRFVEAAEAAGLPLEWQSGPGVHNFRFWNQWLPPAVDYVTAE